METTPNYTAIEARLRRTAAVIESTRGASRFYGTDLVVLLADITTLLAENKRLREAMKQAIAAISSNYAGVGEEAKSRQMGNARFILETALTPTPGAKQ